MGTALREWGLGGAPQGSLGLQEVRDRGRSVPAWGPLLVWGFGDHTSLQKTCHPPRGLLPGSPGESSQH